MKYNKRKYTTLLNKVSLYSPPSTRQGSSEVYFVGINKK